MNRGIMGKYWNMPQLNDLIKFCSMFGSWHSKILQLLNTKADIIISMGTLRWIFKKHGDWIEGRMSLTSNPYQTLLLWIDPQSIAIFLQTCGYLKKSERKHCCSHIYTEHTHSLFLHFSFLFMLFMKTRCQAKSAEKTGERYLIEKLQHVVAYPNCVSAMCSGIHSDLGLNLAFV